MSFIEHLEEAISADQREYQKRLKNHDWYFQHSDDQRAYKKGKDNWDRIMELKPTVDSDGKIMSKYQPDKKIVKQAEQPKDVKLSKKEMENRVARDKQRAEARKAGMDAVNSEFMRLMKKNRG